MHEELSVLLLLKVISTFSWRFVLTFTVQLYLKGGSRTVWSDAVRDWERISATTTVCVQAINHITIQLLLPNSYFIALFLSVHSYLTPIFSTFFSLSSILYLLFFTPTFSFSLLPVCDLSWHLVESSSRSKGLEGRAQAHHPTSAHTLSVA